MLNGYWMEFATKEEMLSAHKECEEEDWTGPGPYFFQRYIRSYTHGPEDVEVFEVTHISNLIIELEEALEYAVARREEYEREHNG